MKKIYSFLIVLLPVFALSQGHILGTFPSMDGGFENQPLSGVTVTGATPFASTQSNYTDNNAAVTATFKATGGRSGPQYIEILTGASAQGFYTPTAALAQNTSYVVQYFFRYNSATSRGMQVAASPNGGANFGTNSIAANVASISAWTKRTEVITSANFTSNSFGTIRFNASAGAIATAFDFDDIVVYPGASADVTAPGVITSPVISNASLTSQNVSWTAPAGGVDGGGYVVVRYTATPGATDDPNQNGVYDVGSLVTVTSTGTVVYIGTATNFVSTSLSRGTTYYYKIYAVDKAFNYSTEVSANLTAACTTPAAPTVTSPVNYCQNAAATQLSATGSMLMWNTGTTTGSAGGTSALTNVTFIEGRFGPSTNLTSFTTTAANVTLKTVDYYIPAYQATTGLVLSLYNSAGTAIATSSTTTTFTASGTPVAITNTFNYLITTAGDYSIRASAGYGNIGGDNPTFPLSDATGTIFVTGSNGGYRSFNDIQFSRSGSSTAPTPSTTSLGTTNYTVNQNVGGCVSSNATIAVVVSATPTTSTAGADQSPCGSTSVTLAGNTATVGTGAWSIVSGSGGTVTTPSSPTSTFTGTAGTAYVLRWTISNSCGSSTDDVNITFNQNPTTSSAGADQTSSATCGLTTVTLAANAPSVGTGAWSIVSGAGGTVTTPTSATSTFTGAAGASYTLRWTISNTPCTASTDDVIITFNQSPTTANAGADQTGAATCGSTTVSFAANTPSIGTGTWSIISGTGGSITTPSSATSTFTGIAGNSYTLRWTISNSPCTASTDDVIITFSQILNNDLDFTNGSHATLCATAAENGSATLTAPAGTVFIYVGFASYGTPGGSCSAFTTSSCHSATSQSVSDGYLLGNNTATIPATNAVFGDPCSGTVKRIYVQATYTQPICSGTTPGTITGTTPTGGNGTFAYLWEQSTTSFSSGFTTASGTSNAKDYTPGSLTQTTWYRRTVTSAGCSNVSHVIQVTVVLAGTWTGASSTTWNAGGNWLCGAVPTSATNAIIPGGLGNYPVLNTGTGTVQNITIQSGASVTVTGATLQIAGAISNSGTFTASAGTIEFNGSTPQTIPASAFAGNKILNLIISNNVTLAGQDSVTGALSFGNVNSKTFTTGSFLTLKSTAAGTARLADITNNSANSGNAISGNVTVERFITSYLNRAYRLLGPSVTTTSSIHVNWQEGATSYANNPKPNYGTHITGTTADQTNGFDRTITGQGSMFTYNQATSAWVAAANTNVAVLNALTGYLIYIRGDRSIDLDAQGGTLPSVVTTLRATGTLLTGTQTFSSLAGNSKFSLITNPFASPINWTTVQAAATNVTNAYTLWDPNYGTRGGYVTVNTSGVASSGVATQNIQSGQAFFVQASGVPSPTVTVRETDKSSTNNIDVFSPVSPVQTFSTSLYFTQADGTERIADGAIAVFDNNYTGSVDNNDAEEISNWDENIALARNGKNLSIESRPVITGHDTLFLFMNHMKAQSYSFVFAPNLNVTGTTAELVDKFSGSRTSISLTDSSTINFTVSSIAASAATDRFYIVFAPVKVLPVTLTSINAFRKNTGIQVEWTTQSESNMDRYEVEKSSNGQSFIKAASVSFNGNSNYNSHYNWFDANPYADINYYRVRSVDKNGQAALTRVVKVYLDKNKAAITVSPNPVTRNTFVVMIKDLPKGNYIITITNDAGQLIHSATLDHKGGSATEVIDIKTIFTAGTYQLKLQGKGILLTQQLLKF